MSAVHILALGLCHWSRFLLRKRPTCQCLNLHVGSKNNVQETAQTLTCGCHWWLRRFSLRVQEAVGLQQTLCEREIFTSKSHISLWEHSSHFRLIGRGVHSASYFFAGVQFSLLWSPPGNIPRSPYERSGVKSPTSHTASGCI